MKTAGVCFTTLALFLVCGCASAPMVPEVLSRADLSAGNGLLVGSVSRAPGIWPYTTYALYFRKVGSGADAGTTVKFSSTNSIIELGKHKFDDDYVTDESSGAIFANLLPAGEYEFYQYYLYTYGGGAETTFESKEDFSIKFTVTPGHITYIGEFRAEPLQAKNMFGIKIPDGVDWSLHNNRERDIAILIGEHPDLAGTPSDSAIDSGCASIYDR